MKIGLARSYVACEAIYASVGQVETFNLVEDERNNGDGAQ